MRIPAVLAALALALAACAPATVSSTTEAPAVVTTDAPVTTTTAAPDPTTTTTTEAAAFPVTVETDSGPVTIDSQPNAIISLSPTATEMLFAIGAGEQVIAVDDQSNYPPEAPMTDLSGFTPNLEAILALEPDLVVISFDPGGLAEGLGAAEVPVLTLGTAASLDDAMSQFLVLGAATGNPTQAEEVVRQIQDDLTAAVEAAAGAGEEVTYYYEISSDLYSATSATFIGEIFGLYGMVNIADEADPDGSAFGFPQLSSEYIVAKDPDIIFLSNTLYGESAATVAARPGWEAMSAVKNGNIVELDSDVASRWGPRIVEFAQAITDALRKLSGG